MTKRYLVLAEGKSGDPHYGKTMRGIVHYAPDPVVAILDSERVGESYREIPIVGTVEDALAYGPTTATVGVATQGGLFPPAWRERTASSSATCASRPPGSTCRPARTSSCRRRTCSPSAPTARSGR